MFNSSKTQILGLSFLSLIGFVLTPKYAHATIYCSYGGGYLKVGMSQAQVKSSCGTPIAESKKKTYATRNVAVQQLFYTVKQTARNVYGPKFSAKSLDMVITVRNNKVTSINLSGTNAQGVSVCPNGAIQVGSAVNTVTQACGYPSYVNQSYQKVSQGNIVEEVTWQLKPTQYGQPLTLIFNDGVLTSIQ